MSASTTTATATTWLAATLLSCLAAQQAGVGFEFTAEQMRTWPGMAELTHTQQVYATSRLCALGFIKHRKQHPDERFGSFDYQVEHYTVTANGAGAVQAHAEGYRHKSGPKTTRGAAQADPAAFATRLWNLLRLRRMLTPSEGAETLCDAGDDKFEQRRDTARKCLRRWCNAGALVEAERRVGAKGLSNGEKRYVLVKDSLQPPRWRKPATKCPVPGAGGPVPRLSAGGRTHGGAE